MMVGVVLIVRNGLALVTATITVYASQTLLANVLVTGKAIIVNSANAVVIAATMAIVSTEHVIALAIIPVSTVRPRYAKTNAADMETAWKEESVHAEEDGMEKIAARPGAQARVNMLIVPGMGCAYSTLIQLTKMELRKRSRFQNVFVQLDGQGHHAISRHAAKSARIHHTVIATMVFAIANKGLAETFVPRRCA